MNEKRSATDPSVSTSQRGPFLEFPPFHQRLLMQTSWDARETSGRIKVLLSEQLIRKTSTQRALDFGPSNDIVCFAFQHGPRGELALSGNSEDRWGSVACAHRIRHSRTSRYLVANSQSSLPPGYGWFSYTFSISDVCATQQIPRPVDGCSVPWRPNVHQTAQPGAFTSASDRSTHPIIKLPQVLWAEGVEAWHLGSVHC